MKQTNTSQTHLYVRTQSFTTQRRKQLPEIHVHGQVDSMHRINQSINPREEKKMPHTKVVCCLLGASLYLSHFTQCRQRGHHHQHWRNVFWRTVSLETLSMWVTQVTWDAVICIVVTCRTAKMCKSALERSISQLSLFLVFFVWSQSPSSFPLLGTTTLAATLAPCLPLISVVQMPPSSPGARFNLQR